MLTKLGELAWHTQQSVYIIGAKTENSFLEGLNIPFYYCSWGVLHIIVLFVPSPEHRKRPVSLEPKEMGSAERRYQTEVFQFCKYQRRRFLTVKSKSKNFYFHLNWSYFILLIIRVSSTKQAAVQGISHLPSWGEAVTHEKPHRVKMCHCGIFFPRNSFKCGLFSFIFYSHTMNFHTVHSANSNLFSA